MILIGLTGGLASGKSTVARMLESKGGEVIDADVIARQVVAPGSPAFGQIVDRFGREVVGPDGTLNRQALADLVFKDAAARSDLESITLPEIYSEIARLIEQYRASDRFVVVDAALLVETADRGGSTGRLGPLGLDALVVVRSEQDLQIKRVIEHRGMDEVQAGARLASQAPMSLKLAAADYVIDNRGSMEELRDSVDTLWSELEKRFE